MRSPEGDEQKLENISSRKDERDCRLKKFRLTSRANISRLGRSSTFVRPSCCTARRRENDLRSRTYSESDLATRKRPFTARRVDRDMSDIGKSVASISYLPRDMIDPREKHCDYN